MYSHEQVHQCWQRLTYTFSNMKQGLDNVCIVVRMYACMFVHVYGCTCRDSCAGVLLYKIAGSGKYVCAQYCNAGSVTHASTWPCIHARIHLCMCMYRYVVHMHDRASAELVYMHSGFMYARTCEYRHAPVYSRTYTYTHAHAHMHTCTQTQTCRHRRTHTHACMQTDRHTDTKTHTRT